jgi:hypothetical protein
LEEAIGTNWFPKLGITLVVLGVAWFLRSEWEHIPAIGRIALFYLVGGGLLGAGVSLERKENYKMLGWALIGGGWAITFVTTYAAHHIPTARVLNSLVVDLFLLLLVAGLMVWHTLKYNSQTVTGTAFLLGFIAVTLSHNTAYSLGAGLILVSGMTIIVLRRQWFELEVFGILASYLNHLYWLYWIINPMGENKVPFPEYWTSVALLSSFWLIFRISYLLHKVSDEKQELVSTIAALLNPLLFLGALKYQAIDTKWAFTTLLTIGALEFVFGQLPVARRRRLPFQILSSLGATLMVAAVPYKYSGNDRVLLWLAGGQAFLLAGIFAREKLFRWFGGIVFFLVAVYLLPARVVPLAEQILNRLPVYNANFCIIFAVLSVVFYSNAHVLARMRQDLFQEETDKQAISALSLFASVFAVCAVYSLVPTNGAAVVLAFLVTALSWTGQQFGIADLVYQAHWIAVVAIVDVTINGLSLSTPWHGIPERILTFGAVATLLYCSSRFVRLSQTQVKDVLYMVYRWAASGLVTVLIWKQAENWLSAVLWIGFALVLSIVTQALKANEFKWQAFVLAMLAFCRALLVNFDAGGAFHGVSYRLISITLIAGGTYLLVSRSPRMRLKPAYTCAATILLGYLAYKEAPDPWRAVAWMTLAATVAFAGRYWKDRVLLWQSHILSALASAAIFVVNFQPQYKRSILQLITVGIATTFLYGLTWVTDVAGVIEDERISQTYSWAASFLLSWLMWYQLQPISVALAWAVFGLLLFELGHDKPSAYLRAQGYVALVSSFVRIFFVNLNQSAVSSWWYTVVPLVPIYFWVYWRLHAKKAGEQAIKVRMEDVLACIGSATVAALARFEMPLDTVAFGYSLIVVALLTVMAVTRLQIFLFQALVMLGVTAFRLSMYDFHRLHNSFSSSVTFPVLAILVLAVGVPIAFQVREPKTENSESPGWIKFLVRSPEQPMFFASVVLMAVLLVIKLDVGWNTLTWGLEGLVVVLAAFFARERSFRLTGMGLLLLCILKLVCWDAWKINDPRAPYLSFIGLGAFILVVAYLFSRNRKALRENL